MARLDRRRLTRCAWRGAIAAMSLGACAGQAEELPRVVSTNLCTDQLVLALADPDQILSVSWLAADAEESLMAEAASRHLPNYGTAEALLRLDPDVVVGGEYTSTFALGLIERLGVEVVNVAPANDVDGIARNMRRVGAAIGQSARAEAAIARMRAEARALAASGPAERVEAVVVRPGGYTVGAGSLADALMRLAGLDNVAAAQGLDRWGSLSIETLVRSEPELLVLVDYHRASPSLANAVFSHPALRGLDERVPAVRVDAARFACGLPESLETARELQAAANAVAAARGRDAVAARDPE